MLSRHSIEIAERERTYWLAPGRTPGSPLLVVLHGSGLNEVLDRMRGPVFAQARTTEGFDQAQLDPETRTVIWPGGADLAPDTLYERISTGLWPEQNLAA